MIRCIRNAVFSPRSGYKLNNELKSSGIIFTRFLDLKIKQKKITKKQRLKSNRIDEVFRI